MTDTPQLTLCLKAEESLLKESLLELFAQANISVKESLDQCEACLSIGPFAGTSLPSLDLESLPKPIKLSDLLSMLANLPYRQQISFSHYTLDLREKLLKNTVTEDVQRLTEKECQLIRFLHFFKGSEVPKEKILKEIWSYHPDTDTHTLETHIYRLRQKLEENPNAPKILCNGKKGYALF